MRDERDNRRIGVLLQPPPVLLSLKHGYQGLPGLEFLCLIPPALNIGLANLQGYNTMCDPRDTICSPILSCGSSMSVETIKGAPTPVLLSHGSAACLHSCRSYQCIAASGHRIGEC